MRRHALMLLALMLAAVPAAARDLTLSLSWPDLDRLPPGTEALFELRNAEGELLRSRFLPLPPDESALHTVLEDVPGPVAQLRAGIVSNAQVIAATRAVTLPETRSLTLEPLQAGALPATSFSQPLRCAAGPADFLALGADALRVRHDGMTYVLPRLEEGPRGWFGANDSDAWLHGNMLKITLSGADLGECRPALPPILFPFDAAGQQGEWVLRITEDAMSLRMAGDDAETTVARPPVVAVAGRLELDGQGLGVTLSEGLCHDRVSGMPFPVIVGLDRGADILPGCGGDPLMLLRGAEWHVISLFGIAIDPGQAEMPELTMRFIDGRVSGRGACNLYLGDVAADRAGLRFGQMASTRMACPASLQALERRFLDALDQITRFDIGREGIAIFYAGQSPVMTLRR